MTYIQGSVAEFASDSLAGLSSAYGTTVRRVDGGVARHQPLTAEKVAVVVGGGSGHYPAFAGLVGAGLADGAVVGEVFASPSTRGIVSVAHETHQSAGVVLSYGNYQGDLLNFGAAQQLLRTEGVDVRSVIVTDDIASAPAGEENRRRGVAGDLIVFKVLGAAAEAGWDVDSVEGVGTRANDLTRTLGIAFKGCTLPGAAVPLFEVPPDTMAIGMGVHGEPGLRQSDLLPISDLAELLVNSLLAERPADATGLSRVGAVLNGLGSTKAEELFALWSQIEPRLTAAGLTIIAPEVGEFVTSLDMAGCSLTLVWLDEELERLWLEPCETVGFHRVTHREYVDHRPTPARPNQFSAPVAPEASQRGARELLRVLGAVVNTLAAAETDLGRLDALAGDGDHGRGMSRGSRAAFDAANQAVDAGAGAGSVLRHAGEAWADQAGGTSGLLWGAALVTLGEALGDVVAINSDLLRQSLLAAIDRVAEVGGAERGDKTMLDAGLPLRDVLAAGGSWFDAISAARLGAENTASMLPRRGRARTAGERNLGDKDPGAVSLALIAGTVLKELEGSMW